jgi:hypothetical protein
MSYERGHSDAKRSKDKNMGDYLKNDYLTEMAKLVALQMVH